MALINYLTKVHFADGVFEEALWAEFEAGKKNRPLIVGNADHLAGSMGERLFAGLPVRCKPQIFDTIPQCPSEEAARMAADVYKANDCDIILAFGSSQAINLAKVIRAAVVHDGSLLKLTYRRGGATSFADDLPNVIAVPGIFGFGDAVSAQTPLTLTSGDRSVIVRKELIPNVTICDPTLTLDATPEQSAASGVDAITHCIEAYLSKSYNPPAEGIALDGLARAAANLGKVLAEGDNIDARREMMAASLNGALALQKGLGACYAISNALNVVTNEKIDQGAINRIALPAVLNFNESAAPKKYENLKKAFDLGCAENIADGVDSFFNSMPLPKNLSTLGLQAHHLNDAAELACDDIASETNPKTIIANDYLSIMNSVY